MCCAEVMTSTKLDSYGRTNYSTLLPPQRPSPKDNEPEVRNSRRLSCQLTSAPFELHVNLRPFFARSRK